MSHFRNCHQQQTKAFTLTELAIVLGITGLILGAIWIAAGSVYANLRVSQAATETLLIVQNFKSLYGGNRNGQAPDNADITEMTINAGLMPANMIKSGVTSYAIGPWSGSQVTIMSSSAWDAVTISFWNLDQSTCNRLADAIATGAFTPSGLICVGINNNVRILPPNGNDAPFTPAEISSACAGANGGSYVQVTYTVF